MHLLKVMFAETGFTANANRKLPLNGAYVGLEIRLNPGPNSKNEKVNK
jgi:hypothetical protein